MALIVRIDVDRPYGRHPLPRHLLSRIRSDYGFPRVFGFGYLRELKRILELLNERQAPAYVFFRGCTLPTAEVTRLLDGGRHEIGMHLENSRTFETFTAERGLLEAYTGRKVLTFSKHGSGGARYGRHHYAAYEPDRYIAWGQQAGMKLFLGNLEDPTMPCTQYGALTVFPAAFWLEPYWRDTSRFTVQWLVQNASRSDIVLLIHPENVLESAELTNHLQTLVSRLGTRILP